MLTTAIKRALLILHYGTPATLEDVLPYYTHIRRGRPPTEEQLNNLVERYRAIGGPSPLAAISRRQALAIQAGLEARGVQTVLYVGAKHAAPFVADAVRSMVADGVDDAVAVVLAPHYSTLSIETYRQYARAALNESGSAMRLSFLERWGSLDRLIVALADRVRAAMGGLESSETLVIFSAHSLPERILATGDPYVRELLETSKLVATAAGVQNWTFAFQSASGTGEPWLGPDILDVIRDSGSNYKNIVACTVGFVSDHLEVLYDLGIEARDACDGLGIEFRMAATIGDDETVMDGLANLAFELFYPSDTAKPEYPANSA